MANPKRNGLDLPNLRTHLIGLDSTTRSQKFVHLARAITGADDPAVTCEACRPWLAVYIDAEVSGLTAETLYPSVKRHLDLCLDCEEAYLEILELALVEETGALPEPAQFPTPDLSFLK